jgi:hypothetical protein
MMSFKVKRPLAHSKVTWRMLLGEGGGGSSFWKKQQLEIVELITSQEDASNQLSTGISAFVEKTSTMNKVCIASSPRAPWRIFIDNPLWCSKRNYL